MSFQQQESGADTVKKRKKLSLKNAADALTATAERHLANMAAEEQDGMVAAFSRRSFGPSKFKPRRQGSTVRTLTRGCPKT
jgi:hypothetical protein